MSQVGGVLCLVLNSQLFYDSSLCPGLRESQDAWLDEQLHSCSTVRPCLVLIAHVHSFILLQRTMGFDYDK